MSYEMHQVLHAALQGVIVAAAVDFAAFRKWQSFDEAKKYAWGLAAWRWFQGAVLGAGAYFGVSAFL